MAINLNTGNGIEVSAAADGSLYRNIIGDGFFVCETGNQFKAEIVSNTSIKVLDGDAIMQGRHIWTKPNDSTTLTIANGEQGKKRVDAILVTYTNNAGSEKVELEVQKGKSGSDYDESITISTGNILNGASKCQVVLYRIYINGLAIEKITSNITKVPSIYTICERLDTAEKAAKNYVSEMYHGQSSGDSHEYGVRRWNNGSVEMWARQNEWAITGSDNVLKFTFAHALPDTSYQVFLTPEVYNTAEHFTDCHFIVRNKTVNGFEVYCYRSGTYNIEIGLSVYIAYLE